jgi:hypothetical protein
MNKQKRGGPHYLVSIDLASGRETSRADFGVVYNPIYDSLTGGDGLVFKCPVRRPKGVSVFDVRVPARITLLGTLEPTEGYGWCTTGAYADGRYYFRRWNRMACYDFRK